MEEIKGLNESIRHQIDYSYYINISIWCNRMVRVLDRISK